MNADQSLPSLPDPPRSLDAAVRRRAWMEPRVRFWWLAAVVLLILAAYFGIARLMQWRRENQLLSQGLPVDAMVVQSEGVSVRGQKVSPQQTLQLEYQVNGKTYSVSGILPDRKEFVQIKSTVPLRVDPQDPRRWTGRTQPSPLLASLIGLWITLPVALLAFIAAWWRRFRMLRLWTSGKQELVEIVEISNSASAPGARVVRCAPLGGRDKRVLVVHVRAKSDPRVGQQINILRDNTDAVAVSWLQAD